MRKKAQAAKASASTPVQLHNLTIQRQLTCNVLSKTCRRVSTGKTADRALLSIDWPCQQVLIMGAIRDPVDIMQVKFSEDVVPLSDLKINPGKVVDRAQATHRPILLTSRGRGVAVVQGLEDYEKNAEELRFVKAVAQGLMDAREGNAMSLGEARNALGLK